MSRGRFELVVRDDPPAVLCPWRYATGEAVSRDRAKLEAFTMLEASEFCPQADSKDGGSCDGLDGVPVWAAAALFISPAAAIAATSSDSVSGFEYAATSTQGRFAGIAAGALPGAWSVTVDHTPLGTSATITGGDFHLATRLARTLTAVTGDFTRGTIRQLSGFTGCASQRYTVNGVLRDVGSGSVRRGTGTFAATLTHHRTTIFGHCVTYAATVSGSLSLAPS